MIFFVVENIQKWTKVIDRMWRINSVDIMTSTFSVAETSAEVNTLTFQPQPILVTSSYENCRRQSSLGAPSSHFGLLAARLTEQTYWRLLQLAFALVISSLSVVFKKTLKKSIFEHCVIDFTIIYEEHCEEYQHLLHHNRQVTFLVTENTFKHSLLWLTNQPIPL